MGDDTTGTGVRPARSSVLRLRGLPFQATESDIEEFFTGYDLKQCQICKRNGRSTGEAYVQLETEAVAGQALQELNCKHMGRRYIEIFEASESDLSPGLEGKGVLGYVLRLRGLPYSATRSDVEKFFESVQIYKGEEGVVFSVTSSGRPTGEAYVEFMSEEAQQDAMKRHKQHMGSRYIELFKSTKADLLQALQQNRFYKEQAERRQWLAQNVPAIPADSSGLRSPYNPAGQVEDVTKFLQSLSVNQQNYQVMPGGQDPSGGYQNYEGQQEAAGGQDESGHYAPRDAHQNYVDSPHYPSGPGPPGSHMGGAGQMGNSAHHYHGGGRGRMGAGHQAPPGVQPGQQMAPHDMMMMQQHYLMQQHMMQQQQLGGWDVPPHSNMQSGQAPYPSGYGPLSGPGMPMGRGGFAQGPLPYMYPAPAPTSSLPPQGELGEGNDSGLDISAGGGSPPVDGKGDM
ncbi:hypothetical protein BSKO_09971 [Bryopsis sp. KO-2023]|nr:hypothetical protein BSKO_09971 [Bryopsis sp. KO-2023]